MRCLWLWGDFGQPVSWSSGLCSFVAGWIWLEVESHPATSPPRRALLTIRHHSRQVFQLLGQTHLTPGENYSCVVPYSICWLSILTLCPPPGSGWLFVPRTHGFPIAAPGRPFGIMAVILAWSMALQRDPGRRWFHCFYREAHWNVGHWVEKLSSY